MDDARPAKHEQSLGDLLAELTRELTTLVRQEASLAKAELSEKAAHVGRDVALLAAGGAVAYAGLLALIAAIILSLGRAGMEWWAAALLVGIVVAAVGGFLVWRGVTALKHEDLVPRETLETLKGERDETRSRRDRVAGY